MKKDDILDFDFQGWPVYKLTLKDIIEESRLFDYDDINKVYYIKDDDPRLDIYPTTLENDDIGDFELTFREFSWDSEQMGAHKDINYMPAADEIKTVSGAVYKKSEQGIFPMILTEFYSKRKAYK